MKPGKIAFAFAQARQAGNKHVAMLCGRLEGAQRAEGVRAILDNGNATILQQSSEGLGPGDLSVKVRDDHNAGLVCQAAATASGDKRS